MLGSFFPAQKLTTKTDRGRNEKEKATAKKSPLHTNLLQTCNQHHTHMQRLPTPKSVSTDNPHTEISKALTTSQKQLGTSTAAPRQPHAASPPPAPTTEATPPRHPSSSRLRNKPKGSCSSPRGRGICDVVFMVNGPLIWNQASD